MRKRQLLPEALAALTVSSPKDELTIDAAGAEVRRASEWLGTACRRHDVPQALAERLVLCLNEVLANVIDHGGRTALSASIWLLLEVTRDEHGSKAGVTVSDAGAAFNPLSAPEKVLPKTLAEASPGGLGLVMIRRCSDWLDYRHEEGRNHFTFGTRWNLH
jgi:anti-sigma regulatory factor (Ser/Thr protein kinase)